MTIRNNTFYIKTIGDTYWDYKSAIYIHPVTYGGGLPSSDNPIHKNITIEGNTFNMSDDTVVKAESVENLTIRNNIIRRTDPDFAITLSGSNALTVGQTSALTTVTEGTTIIGDNNKNLNDTTSRTWDNVFEFTACKNVIIEGNTYDDGMKNYAVISNMPESNLDNRDEEITTVTSSSMPAGDPLSDLVYVSTNPDVVSVNASGEVTALAAGTAEVYAYYVWHDTITKSNAISFTVTEGEVSGTEVAIGQEGTIILNDETTSAALTANTDVTWSASDFLTGGATNVVTVAADGTVTAVSNGIAWVKASANGSEDKIPVVVSLTRSEGLAAGFSITREDTTHYSLADHAVTITQQGGSDLWTYDNTLKNLFLYSGFDCTDLRAIVRIDGLPVRASNNWDTASFILYAGDDDYVTIGKKGHKNGIATVVEQAQSCTEFEESTTDNNNVTSAWFGFTVENGTVTMDYKLDGGEWVTAKTADASILGDAYKIGFGAWGTGGNDVTFSQLRVCKASEGDYDMLMAEEPIPIGFIENLAPAVSNVAFEAASYAVGEKATVTYTYSDPNGNAEGQSLYLWSYGGTTAVTSVPEFTVMAAGELTCAVYPVDAIGAPGMPVSATVTAATGSANLALSGLTVNGAALDVNGDTAYEVRIPADLTCVELAYQSLMAQEGTTTVNGTVRGNTDRIALNVDGVDTITVTRSADGQESKTYTITLVRIDSNATAIQGIQIPELSFSATDLSAGYWGVRTTDASATLKVLADDTIGSVEVRYNNYRAPIAMTKTADGYEGDISFITGLNSYYVTVIAKDGVTRDQYNVNVVYTPDTTSQLQDLKINGVSVAGFDPATYKYLVALDNADALTLEAVSDQNVRIRIGDRYIMEDAGENSLTISDLAGGTYEAYIVTVADDGIVKTVYQADLVVPYEENVELFSFTVGGTDILEAVDENGAATISINGATANVEITAMDASASILAISGSDETSGTGSVSHTVTLVDGTAALNVTVTARDGVTSKTYTITINKVFDPNDSSRDIPVSVLIPTAGDWQTGYEATEGPANLVLDNNTGTIWHTNWYGTSRAGHWIQFELTEGYVVDGLRYQPRQSGSANGTILGYEIQVSDDGVNFETVATGTWANNTSWKGAEFEGRQVKYVRLVATNSYSDSSYVFASAAEIRLTGVKGKDHTPNEAVRENEVAATCTESGSYDSVIYCAECGEEISRETITIPATGHDHVSGTCACGDTLGVAYNAATETVYDDAAAALAAAKAGDTVYVLRDHAVTNVLVTPGVTLDLNGRTLTATFAVGFETSNVIDSAGSGKLIVAEKNVVLDEGNAMVPVYDGTGYIFTQVGFVIQKVDGYEGDGIQVKALACPVSMAAVDLLRDGASDNNIQVMIVLTWSGDNGTGSQKFVFNDGYVQDVFSSQAGKWNQYVRMFLLTITGAESVENLVANIVVVSGTNAAYVGDQPAQLT